MREYSDVENVNIAHLQAFYRTYYQPDNAVLIVTGKFDPGKVLTQISRYFGVIPKPKRVLEPTWTVEPVQDGPRAVTLERVGASPLATRTSTGRRASSAASAGRRSR